jgi:hypothetical protein
LESYFKNFKTENHSIVTSLLILDPLIKQKEDHLLEFHSLVNLVLKLKLDEIFTNLYFFIFADVLNFDILKCDGKIEFREEEFLLGLCDLANKENIKLMFIVVRMMSGLRNHKEMCNDIISSFGIIHKLICPENHVKMTKFI